MCKPPQKKTIEIAYSEYSGIDHLPADLQQLLTLAYKETHNAYALYSKFQVGAALRLSDGAVIPGSNQENASYPAGLCAERVALFSAAGSHPGKTIEWLAVTAKNKTNSVVDPVFPCGFCLQVMVEMERKQNRPIQLIIGQPDTRILVFDSSYQLLPFAFNADQL